MYTEKVDQHKMLAIVDLCAAAAAAVELMT